MKDIFRKYPNKYESVIAPMCQALESLDEPNAKASMIWILGEYIDIIDNVADILDTMLDTFHEETPLVWTLFIRTNSIGPTTITDSRHQALLEASWREWGIG